nr:MAG TPA: hypothetical protein [Caudoviricetes sp.]
MLGGTVFVSVISLPEVDFPLCGIADFPYSI